jgi:hypothetical protein
VLKCRFFIFATPPPDTSEVTLFQKEDKLFWLLGDKQGDWMKTLEFCKSALEPPDTSEIGLPALLVSTNLSNYFCSKSWCLWLIDHK